MKASGNGRPEQCVANLLMITRGEVPYERLKGLDSSLIDRPSSIVSPELGADVEWMLRTYEPRMQIDNIDLESLLAVDGHFGIKVDTTNKQGVAI